MSPKGARADISAPGGPGTALSALGGGYIRTVVDFSAPKVGKQKNKTKQQKQNKQKLYQGLKGPISRPGQTLGRKK